MKIKSNVPFSDLAGSGVGSTGATHAAGASNAGSFPVDFADRRVALARNLVLPHGTRIGAAMPDQPPFFLVQDIARMWGEERARAAGKEIADATPVAAATVHSYIKHSKPGPRSRYADNPMPAPTYLGADDPEASMHGRTPIWQPEDGETMADLEHRIRAWWHSRVGPGVGGGPKPKVTTVACPCGCGQQVAPGSMCDQAAALRAGVAW
jgi:hypothetical protein